MIINRNKIMINNKNKKRIINKNHFKKVTVCKFKRILINNNYSKKNNKLYNNHYKVIKKFK